MENMNKEQIAQWVIDNRYPKSEKEKISDFEMYHTIIDMIDELLIRSIKKVKNQLKNHEGENNKHRTC